MARKNNLKVMEAKLLKALNLINEVNCDLVKHYNKKGSPSLNAAYLRAGDARSTITKMIALQQSGVHPSSVEQSQVMGKYYVQSKIPGYDEDSDLGGWRDIPGGTLVTKRKAYSLAKKFIDQNPDKHVQIIVPEQLEFYQSATP